MLVAVVYIIGNNGISGNSAISCNSGNSGTAGRYPSVQIGTRISHFTDEFLCQFGHLGKALQFTSIDGPCRHHPSRDLLMSPTVKIDCLRRGTKYHQWCGTPVGIPGWLYPLWWALWQWGIEIVRLLSVKSIWRWKLIVGSCVTWVIVQQWYHRWWWYLR